MSERILLGVFLGSRALLFLLTFGQAVGWDTGVHLAMLDSWPWESDAWDVRSSFYAYHPPLAFLLARSVHVLGIDPVVSVQIVSALASLFAFLCLRWTLLRLGFLHHRWSVAFLYVTSALPIQIYLARSINMDVLIYAFACTALLGSSLLWGGEEARRERWWGSALVWFSVTAAILTKHSGLLLLVLPPLAACLLPGEAETETRARRVGYACSLCVLALVSALPYYALRYLPQTGTLLPSNMEMAEFDRATWEEEKQTVRDADLQAFWRDLLWGTSPGTERIQDRDQARVRMLNTWKDLWAGSRHNVTQSPLSLSLSTSYSVIGALLLSIGIAHLLCHLRSRDDWGRFGLLLTVFAVLHVLALVAYAYRYPHPLGIPNKAIYAAPALIGFGYLLTRPLSLSPLGQSSSRSDRRGVLLIAGLASFVLLNHLLPVY
jgi:hypothetical protein